MGDSVWFSKAPSDSTLQDGFTASDLQLEGDQRAIELSKVARKGGIVAQSDLPSEIWGEVGPYRAHHFPKYWPEISYYSGVWIVSGEVAEILRGFDLGGGIVAPVRRFEKDHLTPVSGEWFSWNVGNLKPAILGDRSQGVLPAGRNKWLPTTVTDHDIKCSVAAMAGADVWYDPQLHGVLFFSGDLGQALIEAGLANEKAGFGRLIKCDVIEA